MRCQCTFVVLCSNEEQQKDCVVRDLNLFVDFNFDNFESKPTHIKTNFHFLTEYGPYGIEYVEGTKVCEIRDYNMYYIPSTCEEIYINRATHCSAPDVINYNGTIEDFNNIKGAQEFISQLESLGEYTITCTNGNITNRRWP